MSKCNWWEKDNCYKGLFWDLETQTFQRWEDYVEHSSGSSRNGKDNVPVKKD